MGKSLPLDFVGKCGDFPDVFFGRRRGGEPPQARFDFFGRGTFFLPERGILVPDTLNNLKFLRFIRPLADYLFVITPGFLARGLVFGAHGRTFASID